MARILLAWEIGFNTGHLLRLLPIARQLKKEGHTVIAAVRDLHMAAKIFGPFGIAFVHAPCVDRDMSLRRPLTGYADILLTQGWGDQHILKRLIDGWCRLFYSFLPDVVVSDFSPTACLAARIFGLRVVCFGNGFEIPPLTAPLPPFPELSWATQERAAKSEKFVMYKVAAVLGQYRCEPLEALRDIYTPHRILLATFRELDHYGERTMDADFIGMIRGSTNGASALWKEGNGPRVFIYLPSSVLKANDLFGKLAHFNARIICVSMDMIDHDIKKYSNAQCFITNSHLNLVEIYRNADLCISYGAEGTSSAFLLAGVPQLFIPGLVEPFLTAKRIEKLGAGLTILPSNSLDAIDSQIRALLQDTVFRESAKQFSSKYAHFLHINQVNSIVNHVCDVVVNA